MLLALPWTVSSPHAADGLGGVWIRVEVSVVTDRGTRTNTNLQSSLYIFTHEFLDLSTSGAVR